MMTEPETAVSRSLAEEAEARPEPTGDRDFMVVPKDALFEFMGEMALPPWTDSDGSTIGGSIDCAPIAERIRAWFKAHDLSDIYLGLGTAEPESAVPPKVEVHRIYEFGGMGRAKGWGVYLDGRLVSDHSTIAAARTAAIRHQGGNPA